MRTIDVSAQYKRYADKMIWNAIYYLPSILKRMNYSAADFCELIGYATSIISRNKKAIESEEFSKARFYPYGLSVLHGIDTIIMTKDFTTDSKLYDGIEVISAKMEVCYLVEKLILGDIYEEEQFSEFFKQRDFFTAVSCSKSDLRKIDWENKKGFVFQFQHFSTYALDSQGDDFFTEEMILFAFKHKLVGYKVAMTVSFAKKHCEEKEKIVNILNKGLSDIEITGSENEIFLSEITKKVLRQEIIDSVNQDVLWEKDLEKICKQIYNSIPGVFILFVDGRDEREKIVFRIVDEIFEHIVFAFLDGLTQEIVLSSRYTEIRFSLLEL